MLNVNKKNKDLYMFYLISPIFISQLLYVNYDERT
jgi:hypothetical protein